MVAVGDDEFFVLHGGEDEVDEMGVGEAPDAVDDGVLVGDDEVGGARVVGFGAEDELLGGEGGVGVEHVDLLAVGAGGFEEGEAVGFVLGEGLLVAVDDFVGVVVEVAQGNEAAAGSYFLRAGDGVGLGVAVEGGLGFLAEDFLAAPGGEGFGGTGVDVLGDLAFWEGGEGVGVGGLFFAQDDADEVVFGAVVVGLLHFRGDFVVGLGDDVFHADFVGVVAEGFEGVNAGHEVDCKGGASDWIATASIEVRMSAGWRV